MTEQNVGAVCNEAKDVVESSLPIGKNGDVPTSESTSKEPPKDDNTYPSFLRVVSLGLALSMTMLLVF